MNELDGVMLAGAAIGLSEEETEKLVDSGADFDLALNERFSVGLAEFCEISEALLNLTPPIQSPLTKSVFHAFGRRAENGNFVALVKKKVENIT